jgi:environmental stress-induced protein Ves
MLSSVLLTEEAYRVQNWKNGLGQTEEICRDSEDPYRWRVSLATLEASGPFSHFPNYDRSLVHLGSSPILFKHGEKANQVPPFTPYGFRGEDETSVEIEAPALDFGLLVKRGAAKGSIYPFRAGKKDEHQFPLSAQEHFLFCCSGSLEVYEPHSQKSWELSPRHCLWLSRRGETEYLNLRAQGLGERNAALWVVVHLSA